MLNGKYINRHSKLTIVLIHGFAASMKQLEPFWKLDFNILAIDLPGHGNSAPAEELLKAHAEGLKLLLEKHKIKQYVILGYSLGVYITLDLLNRGFTPKAVVLLSGGVKIPHQHWACRWRVFEKLVGFAQKHEKFVKKVLAEYRSVHGDFKVGDQYHAPSAIKFLHEVEKNNYTETCRKIKLPTLIIHGELDSVIPLNYGRHLHKLIENSQFVSYPDNHNSIISRKELIPLVETFIEDVAD